MGRFVGGFLSLVNFVASVPNSIRVLTVEGWIAKESLLAFDLLLAGIFSGQFMGFRRFGPLSSCVVWTLVCFFPMQGS